MKTVMNIDVDVTIVKYTEFCQLHRECENVLTDIRMFVVNNIDVFWDTGHWTHEKFLCWKYNTKLGHKFQILEEQFTKAKEIENPAFQIHSILKLAQLSGLKTVQVEMTSEDMIQARLEYSNTAMEKTLEALNKLAAEIYEVVHISNNETVQSGNVGIVDTEYPPEKSGYWPWRNK